MACCPITREVFVDPVLAADGHSYERDAILTWLSVNCMSPLTGLHMQTRAVVPNHALRSVMAEQARCIRFNRRLEGINLAIGIVNVALLFFAIHAAQ